MDSEEEDAIVMVAASKHSSSVSAVRWALSNGMVKEGGTLKLVHVRPLLQFIPSPMDQVSEEIVATYKTELQSETEKYLQLHLSLCDTWKVHADLIIVENDDVSKALLDQIFRFRANKFIIGMSTRNPLIRKWKGSNTPEFIMKHAPEFCTVLVVSKGKLISVQEAKAFPSSPNSKYSNGCSLSDASSDMFSGSDSSFSSSSVTQSEKKAIQSESFTTQKRSSKDFVSQPLSLQRQRAASLITLKRGWSNAGTVRNPGSIKGFTARNISFRSDEKTLYNDKKPELIQLNNGDQIFEGEPITSSEDYLEECKLNKVNADQKSTLNGTETPKPVMSSVSHFRSMSRDAYMVSSILSQSSTAAAQLNRSFQQVVESHQVSDTCSTPSIRHVSEHKHTSELNSVSSISEDEVDFHRLKFDFESAQQRVMKAEKAVAQARAKVEELDAYAKEESKKRGQALLIAQLAKKEAAAEAKKYDDAVMALEAAKLMAEEEAQRRREAEDRANKEASSRQIAVAALKHAKMKYRQYSFEDLKIATNGFSQASQIGVGGYGPVYKGKLHHTAVAIKVLKEDSVQGPKEFQQEVDFLSRMHHPHLVLLLGACPEKGCLVYEYLTNGSLEDRLMCKGDTPPLPWYIRFRIAAEVATTLLFLHSSKPDPYVHRDLKPGNILLDHNFASKLGDVGLARLAPGIVSESVTIYRDTSPVGTFAYIDPEYQRTGVFTPQSDIYALGVVMLQLLTGRGPIGLAGIVEVALLKGTLNEVLDSTCGEWPIHEATEMANLAIQCAQMKRKERPDLETVILSKLQKLRAFADDYIAQVDWGKLTVSVDSLVIPSFFICPISKETMKDPHIAADGYTYEYSAIKRWLQNHKTSPMTNLKLPHKQLTPNHSLRSAISDWNQRLPFM